MTPADRIEDVRRMTPSPRAHGRLGHISKEDFAELIGVSRSRIFAWTRADNPEYPEERHRVRLAELSGGRYVPEDFAPPGREPTPGTRAVLERIAESEARLLARIEALEEQLRHRAANGGR